MPEEKTFIDNFMSTFLATWAATNYSDICLRGQHERWDNMPVEDARFLAKRAWEQVREHTGGGKSNASR